MVNNVIKASRHKGISVTFCFRNSNQRTSESERILSTYHKPRYQPLNHNVLFSKPPVKDILVCRQNLKMEKKKSIEIYSNYASLNLLQCPKRTCTSLTTEHAISTPATYHTILVCYFLLQLQGQNQPIYKQHSSSLIQEADFQAKIIG